ncbi:MAG: hypothetical protein RLZZ546_673 [Bacteroidota bacterium]|jgi:hypothetical protein
MISDVIKTSISVKTIELQPYRSDINQDAKDYWQEKYGLKISELGKDPLLWYNGIYIPPYLIDSFYLTSNEFIPTLQVYFKDETAEMINSGFALDNTVISLYIDSRTKDDSGSPALRPIRMDFKISDYNYMEEENLFYVQGIPDIDGLYVQDIKSYPNKTSFQCLKELCQKIKLGFRSNVADTNDSMTWLNMSLENHAFIKDVTKRVYKGDNSFFTSFVDYYYSLNLVDVEQCMKESIDQQGLLTASDEGIDESNAQIVSDLYIISSKYYNNRYNNLYESYEVLNQSTKVSIANGYKSIVHYYDRTGNWEQKAGTFLRFNLETNTDGKGIVLKSFPNDTKDDGFFKNNVKRIYLQPLDVDNTHTNFNFAYVLNEYNNNEIDKVKIKVTMRNPNFNFYKYQKIKVNVMNISAGQEEIFNERLTGGWLIKEINYYYTPNEGLKQELEMVKRELSAGDYSF